MLHLSIISTSLGFEISNKHKHFQALILKLEKKHVYTHVRSLVVDIFLDHLLSMDFFFFLSPCLNIALKIAIYVPLAYIIVEKRKTFYDIQLEQTPYLFFFLLYIIFKYSCCENRRIS